MADDIFAASGNFDEHSEAAWREAVEKALKGPGPEKLLKRQPGRLDVHPLYRETDFASAKSTGLVSGEGKNAFLPWDIRQAFTHPDPQITNEEILRDLERGVSSVEIKLDSTGAMGCAIADLASLTTALKGVRADLATVALDHGGGTGTSAAALLALWGETQSDPKALRFAFNIDPLGSLQKRGLVEGGIDAAFEQCAALTKVLMPRFPLSTALRIDARAIHEAGGSDAQELGGLVAHGIDTLRRLDDLGLEPQIAADQILFTLSVDANYGLNIAKLRAARRLWMRCLEGLGLTDKKMRLQAASSMRMLTKYDSWVNMLRNTAACFGGAVGGADIVTIRPFTDALGVATELGRRVARNTQLIAMEESNLGKVTDPAAGAWFTETYSEELAEAAWEEFQTLEREGGYGASLMSDAFQSRVAEVRKARMKDIAKRKIPLTGVSEFPQLEEIDPPIADLSWNDPKEGVSSEGLDTLLNGARAEPGEDTMAEPLWPIRLAEPFERLRDHAEMQFEKTGTRPSVFLATLGPLAEHTARVDFARNLFAAGGIKGVEAPVPPQSTDELVAAFKASNGKLAVLCGSDKRYDTEASQAAAALKAAGAQRVFLAGKFEAENIDSRIYTGCNTIETLELAHAELGIAE